MPGAESGWHTHLGEEVGYIVAGHVRMSISGRDSILLYAGDGFLIEKPLTSLSAIQDGGQP
ncbi:cupin domain-containing protein [Streptomyces graminifolii]|uniref:cupin domain-containing protein n=1 Tax=Streptomyces graminifolii TaxID=1266771 RepID=UPI0040597557